jgi:hypothetical protein
MGVLSPDLLPVDPGRTRSRPQVEFGWNMLFTLEEAGSDSGATSKPCTIVDCGVLDLEADPAALAQGAGSSEPASAPAAAAVEQQA